MLQSVSSWPVESWKSLICIPIKPHHSFTFSYIGIAPCSGPQIKTFRILMDIEFILSEPFLAEEMNWSTCFRVEDIFTLLYYLFSSLILFYSYFFFELKGHIWILSVHGTLFCVMFKSIFLCFLKIIVSRDIFVRY